MITSKRIIALLLMAAACTSACDRGGELPPRSQRPAQAAGQAAAVDSVEADGYGGGLKADGEWADSINVAF